MNARKLTLRRETLSELTTSELQSVAGASGAPCNSTAILESLIPSCGCTGNWSIVAGCN